MLQKTRCSYSSTTICSCIGHNTLMRPNSRLSGSAVCCQYCTVDAESSVKSDSHRYANAKPPQGSTVTRTCGILAQHQQLLNAIWPLRPRRRFTARSSESPSSSASSFRCYQQPAAYACASLLESGLCACHTCTQMKRLRPSALLPPFHAQ
jgi:hypothetical protein